MSARLAVALLLTCAFVAPSAWHAQTRAQQEAKPLGKSTGLSRHLFVVEKIPAPSQLATTLTPPLKCDADANVYLHTEPYGVAGINKLSPKAKPLALFVPSSADIKVDMITSFSVGLDGDVYVLAYPHEYVRYVLVYRADGTYKSKIKLQTGFAWTVSAVAAFPSGNLLVAGQRYDTDKTAPMIPFTGLFSSDGTLLKEVVLSDDAAIHTLNVAHDPRVTAPMAPTLSIPVSNTLLEIASDGNAYLMRWTTPAIVYVLSPAGELVRRFAVDPGDENYRPMAFHISGTKIAFSFAHPQTGELIMKVVDLEGHAIETYRETKAEGKTGTDDLGVAFACYTAAPESFLFLSVRDDNSLQFTIAEPR